MGAPRIDMVVSVPLMPDPKSVDRGFKANELTVEERNLLSVGYKNMMSVRRTAFRTVQSWSELPEYQESDGDANNKLYKDTISAEVFNLIKEVIDEVVKVYVDGANAPVENNTEVIVFFKKME